MDIALTYGGDLSLSPTGDLALSDGPQLTQDRVLRRLLTNPTDYIWHLAYGGGLPAMIGQPANAKRIAAIVQSQMGLERTVAQLPRPSVTVTASPDGQVFAQILYADAATGAPLSLTGPVDGLTAGG